MNSPARQPVSLPDDVARAMNGALCDLARRWKLDGDYLRCLQCGRSQLASYAYLHFPHSADCPSIGRTELHPWRDLIRILAPLAEPRPVAEKAEGEIADAWASPDMMAGKSRMPEDVSPIPVPGWVPLFARNTLAAAPAPAPAEGVRGLVEKWRAAANRTIESANASQVLYVTTALDGAAETLRTCIRELESALAPAPTGEAVAWPTGWKCERLPNGWTRVTGPNGKSGAINDDTTANGIVQHVFYDFIRALAASPQPSQSVEVSEGMVEAALEAFYGKDDWTRTVQRDAMHRAITAALAAKEGG